MPPDGVCSFAADDGGEGFRRGLLHFAQAAKVNQEALAGLRADAGNVEKLGVSIPHSAALPVIANGEAMALVADELHEMEHRGTAVENDGLVLGAVEINHLFPFRDGGERLRGESERLERLGGSMKLAETAVDEHQRRHRLVFVFQPPVAALD